MFPQLILLWSYTAFLCKYLRYAEYYTEYEIAIN